MTLQWSAVALILYLEVAVVLILLLPWIRPTLWSKLFKSRFILWIEKHGTVFYVAALCILLLLFSDAIREVRKYSGEVVFDSPVRHTADTETSIHMRLFRAQRNLYISGFALLLFMVIKRISALLIRVSQLQAAAEAALRQAESANQAAKNLMGSEGEREKELERQLEEVGKELKAMQIDRDAVVAQAKGLQKEYDTLTKKLAELDGKSDKKKD